MSLQEKFIESLETENRSLRAKLEKADRLNATLTTENLLANKLIEQLEKNIGTLQGQAMINKILQS